MKKVIGLMLGISIFLATTQSTYAYSLENGQATFFQKTYVSSPLQQSTKLISPFNENRGSYTHQGIDVVAPMFTPIYAIADGVVTKASPDSKGVNKGGGHMIFINHEDGTESWYMHLSAYGVQEGDRVKAGDLIALSGASGEVTGPHLHLEYRVSGVPINPYFIFESFGLFEEAYSIKVEENTFKVIQN